MAAEKRMVQGRRIHINGIVQGVGFRPFVFGLAERFALAGWVRNTSAGVDIEVDGAPAALDAFVAALTAEAPPLAQIDAITAVSIPPNGFTRFDIVHSAAVAGAFQPISPDVSLCADCLRELFDPADRRYLYPFINCTNCGPRFTIIQDIPYDRPLTTMAPFEMCADCRREYEDPRDRRFHAQPVACPVCGPTVWLEDVGCRMSDFGEEAPSEIRNPKSAIVMAQQLLAAGRILAIKGLGGFHLACDATNETAVAELRRRKLRREKPFALMMPDVATVMQHCFVSDAERDLLLDRARPIVLLRRRPDSPIAAACAPGQDRLGVMLPYTPLHYLLFASSESRGAGEQGSRGAGEQGSRGENGSPAPPPLCPPALVMTSGNLSEEPIAYTNDDARQRLAPLANAFLMHNRDIHIRCDDSVMRMVDFGFRTMPISDLGFRISDGASSPKSEIPNPTYLLPLRRSRGYAPFPVRLPWAAPPVLGAGAELKNTFCLTNGRYAFLSHHIGDMENYETLLSFEAGVAHFERLFRVQPALIAYDLHPDYLATRYALARAARESIPAVGVQHHHAHIAAVMAENGHPGDRPVIGVSFDGTGYGTDGTIWGGEFLVADYGGFERPYHLAPVPLPGGDKAVREPWRIALAWLHQAGIDWAEDLAPVDFGFGMSDVGNANRSEIQHPTSDILNVLRHQITRGLNAPLTSSMGRLFDAVAALAGLRQTVSYEAQAAMELEALADPAETAVYPFTINRLPLTINHSQFSIVNSQFSIDPTPLLAAIVSDLRAGISVPIISARFHNGVAQMVLDVCRALRRDTGLNEVALSGGVWQNVTLLARTAALLRAAGFTLLLHTRVPPNDGGLALGQTIIGAMKSK